MNANTKKKIKGIAKTTGKYTLKGLGKGIELVGRGAIKTVNALVKNPEIQTLATAAGILAASVMIPTVGVGLITALGIKYVIDKPILGKNEEKNDKMIDAISDILRIGNVVTKNVSNKILSPALNKIDKNINKLGKKYQGKIDYMFR